MFVEQYHELDKFYTRLLDKGMGEGIGVDILLGSEIEKDFLNSWENQFPFGKRMVSAQAGDKIAIYRDQNQGYWLVGDVNEPWAIHIDEVTGKQYGL